MTAHYTIATQTEGKEAMKDSTANIHRHSIQSPTGNRVDVDQWMQREHLREAEERAEVDHNKFLTRLQLGLIQLSQHLSVHQERLARVNARLDGPSVLNRDPQPGNDDPRSVGAKSLLTDQLEQLMTISQMIEVEISQLEEL